MANKKVFAAVAVAVAVGAGAVFFSANAYRGDMGQKGPNYSPERHAEMQKAFENSDYGAWKNLMQGKGRVSSAINEENFPKFAEMHRLMNEGRYDEAGEIRKDLGLGERGGKESCRGDGSCQGNCQQAGTKGSCGCGKRN